MDGKTPMALITGSLGAGKTTLLGRLLQASRLRIAVLMNEFGEIPIDSRMIRGDNIEIVELAGGCVCCSLTGEFEAAVNEIIAKVHPELIVVEATGVAESDALVFEVEDRLPHIRLDAAICIVDAYAAMRYPQVGYAARTQLASADVILINKSDLVTAEEMDAVISQVRRYNHRAAELRTVRCDVPMDILFGPRIEQGPLPEPPPRGETFESFAVTSSGLLDRARFENFLSDLPAAVFRAKGFVRFPDGGRLFNYVAGRFDFEPFDAEKYQLVFIGPSLTKERADIENQLRACEI